MTAASEQLLTAFDAAVADELPRVSHLEYDSHEICKHFADKLRERLSTHQSEAPSRRGEAVLERLARFALWAIHLHRENECADIDGCSIQEKLVESGILHEKTVTESCGDHCVCMEFGEQDEWQCYFLSDEVVAIDASLNTSPHAPSPVSEDEGGRTL